MVDKNKKTNYWWSLLGLVIAFLIIALLQLVLNKKDNSFDSGVKLGLLAYSKTLPQRIDQFTILDSMKIPSDKILNYYYTIDIDKTEADYKSIEENVNSNILNTIKTSAELDDLRRIGYTWHYLYYDKNGDLFHEYLVTPNMYK